MELQKVVDSQDKLPSEAPIRVHTLPPPPNFPKKTTRSTFPPRFILCVGLQEVVCHI